MDHVINNQLLCDDYMLEIFHHFNAQDLCEMAQVSKQFLRLAQYTFKTKYSNFKLSDHFHNIDLKTLKILFINFGQFMTHLEISPMVYQSSWRNNPYETYTIWLIKQNCNMGNRLKTLKMTDFSRIGRNFISLNKLFTNLEVLELKGVALQYSICKLLGELPKIKEFSVNSCYPKFPIFEEMTTTFNPHLQILTLDCSEIFNPIDVLTQIDEHYRNITELKFAFIPHNLRHHTNFTFALQKIAKLKLLRKLDIDFESHPITKFMQNLVENEIQLEFFHMHHLTFTSEAIYHLCKIQTIKKLGLSRNFNITPDHLIKIAYNLPELEILSAINYDTTIPIIEKIVNIARNLTKVEFELNREDSFTNHSFDRLVKIVHAQNKKEQFQLYIHNYFQRSTNGLDNAIMQFNAANKSIQIQSHDIIGPAIYFD